MNEDLGKQQAVLGGAVAATGKAEGPKPRQKEEEAQMNLVTLSTGKDDWETPQEFFDALDAEFHFTLDACATPENAKCARYFTPEQDGLRQDWQGETVWCNPPYSQKKPGQKAWIQKCHDEAQKPGTTCVMLIPARTDTKAFHEYIYRQAEVRFVRGRLKFGGAKSGAPFPSMVVIFRKGSLPEL